MLMEGTKIIANAKEILPRTEWARQNQDKVFDITQPIANQEETCYFITFYEPKVIVENRKSGKEFILEYSQETLSEFVEWKSMASGDYALGLEPSTTKLDDRFEYSVLEKGASVNFGIRITIRNI